MNRWIVSYKIEGEAQVREIEVTAKNSVMAYLSALQTLILLLHLKVHIVSTAREIT